MKTLFKILPSPCATHTPIFAPPIPLSKTDLDSSTNTRDQRDSKRPDVLRARRTEGAAGTSAAVTSSAGEWVNRGQIRIEMSTVYNKHCICNRVTFLKKTITSIVVMYIDKFNKVIVETAILCPFFAQWYILQNFTCIAFLFPVFIPWDKGEYGLRMLFNVGNGDGSLIKWVMEH